VSAALLWSSADSSAEVWHGDALDPEHVAAIMGDRVADALVVDAPYSARTHRGHDTIAAERTDADTRTLDYAAWGDEDVGAFCGIWLPRVRGWAVSITDHTLAPAWEAALAASGRCGFPPVPIVESGSRCRITGDGPSCWTCWAIVARPRTVPWSRWGTLRGAYLTGRESKPVVGGKPLAAMLPLVGDYSRRGDLVVDPCCGGGTTGLAARQCGRRVILVDRDVAHCEITIRRVRDAREQMTLGIGGAS